MASRKFQIIRQIDSAIIDAFKSIAKDCEADDSANVTVRMADRGQNTISTSVAQLEKNGPLQQLLSVESATLDQLQISIPNIPQGSVTVNRQHGFDEASINFADNVDATQAATLVAAAHRHLHPLDRIESVNRMLGDELAEFYQRREEGLLKLEELNQRLIEENENYRQKIDGQFLEKKATLEEQTSKDRASLQEEFDEKQEDLKLAKTALEDREKALDDRGSKHARRELRNDLKAALESRSQEFALTKQTVRKRLVIHGIFVTLLVVFGTILGRSFIQQIDPSTPLASDSPPTEGTISYWFNIVKLSLGSLAFAATSIFYIRWNDHWFRQHADEEFRLKRLELDIDRASWIVEMALEWQDEKGSPIPEELIERLSIGLFADSRVSDSPRHPSEDLSDALLGASSGLTVNVPGMGELKLDRKGIKKFAKAADGSDR